MPRTRKSSMMIIDKACDTFPLGPISLNPNNFSLTDLWPTYTIGQGQTWDKVGPYFTNSRPHSFHVRAGTETNDDQPGVRSRSNKRVRTVVDIGEVRRALSSRRTLTFPARKKIPRKQHETLRRRTVGRIGTCREK